MPTILFSHPKNIKRKSNFLKSQFCSLSPGLLAVLFKLKTSNQGRSLNFKGIWILLRTFHFYGSGSLNFATDQYTYVLCIINLNVFKKFL